MVGERHTEVCSDAVLQAYHGSVIKRLKRMKQGASWRARRRAISICPEWSADSSTFVQYILHNHAHVFWLQSRMGWFRIERVDPAKGYEPGNVRFVPGEEASRGWNDAAKPKAPNKVLASQTYPIEGGIPLPPSPKERSVNGSSKRSRKPAQRR